VLSSPCTPMQGTRKRDDDDYSDYSRSERASNQGDDWESDRGVSERGQLSDQGSAYDYADDPRYLEEEREFDEEMMDRDKLLHWWCHKQLGRCIRRLRRHPIAGPFNTPLPWKELGLDDYPEIIKTPMDLGTIADRLNDGSYNDDHGFLNPDFFWEDVFLIWDNCLDYYGEDMEIEMCQVADELAQFSKEVEREFWIELEHVEANMDQINPNLGSAAAYADLAACAVEDAAVLAYEEGGELINGAIEGLANWWRGGGTEIQQAPVRRKKIQLKGATRPELRVHFAELLEVQCHFDATDHLEQMESNFRKELETAYLPVGDDDDIAEEPFPDEKLKIPIDGLVPAGFPGLRRPVKQMIVSRSGSRASSISSQGRSSRRRDNSPHGSSPTHKHHRDSNNSRISSAGSVHNSRVSSAGSVVSSGSMKKTGSGGSRASSAAPHHIGKMPQALRHVLGESSSEEDGDTTGQQMNIVDMKAMMVKRKSPTGGSSKK